MAYSAPSIQLSRAELEQAREGDQAMAGEGFTRGSNLLASGQGTGKWLGFPVVFYRCFFGGGFAYSNRLQKKLVPLF